MQKIGEFFGNDTRAAVDRAILPTRSYNQQNKATNYKPVISRFKLKVWFKDGNSKVFYSFDRQKDRNGKLIVDEWSGMMKLIRLVNKWDGKYKCAMIFATIDKTPLTESSNYFIQCMKFSSIGCQENQKVSFLPTGVFDVTKFS